MGTSAALNQENNQVHNQGRLSAEINLACTSWSVEQATVFFAWEAILTKPARSTVSRCATGSVRW
jgi:hypothetical protein